MKLRYHRQPSIPGGREPLPACVLKEISDEVDKLARRYKVSKSWVVATVLADAFNIKEQPSYLKVDARKSRAA